MKKKLEADLMSIAHRVLQMKNKSDINQLYNETQKLLEKLSVLRFVEEHFEGAKPTIGQAEVVAKMKQFFEENHFTEVKPAMTKLEVVVENVVEVKVAEEEVAEEEVAEEEIIEEEVIDQETDEDDLANEESAAEVEVDFNEIEPDEEGEEEILEEEKLEPNETEFQPAFELDSEAEEEVEVSKKAETVQISFDDFFGGDYSDTLFVKLDKETETVEPQIDFELPKVTKIEEDYREELISENSELKTVSLNEKLAKGISIDLNDRIAFVKHLFGNSDEDYNRVLNQLITYDSFEEAQNFIEDMVKPDYNNWEGKEDYAQRFVEIIEKKFS
jgi:hypothetical protein